MAEEKRFETRLKKILKDRGAWYLKTFSDGIQRAGVPDLLVCYKGHFIAIEVKSERGVPTQLQLIEIREIKKAGGYAFVIRPSNLDDLIDLLDKIDLVSEKLKRSLNDKGTGEQNKQTR